MIQELRSMEFAMANLTNLHKIYIKNCTIQKLHQEALRKLGILIELDLSQNFIRELHPGTFLGLTKLRNLIMNNNLIEIIQNYLFADLLFLSRVEFKNNRIKTVEINAFGQLNMLSSVSLEANRLTYLRREIFTHTPKLLHLSLAQNPWNCSCHLQEFRDFVVNNQLYTAPTACNEPSHMKGKQWNEIPSEKFACQPRIVDFAHMFLKAEMDNISLPCRIAGEPRPNVTWLFNKRIINYNDSRIKLSESFENNHQMTKVLTSVLNIFHAMTSDKGIYTCMAENRAGYAEAEFQLIINNDIGPFAGKNSNFISSSNSEKDTNLWIIICLIASSLLLLLIIIVLKICCYCKNVKTYRKDINSIGGSNRISSKEEKNKTSIIEGGSIIMEMQKGLLTEVNPVEKPPRRTELDNIDNVGDDVHGTEQTLLNNNELIYNQTSVEHLPSRHSSMTHNCPNLFDNKYGSSLPPDLLAFQTCLPPKTPSNKALKTNLSNNMQFNVNSPPIASPVYSGITAPSSYGNSTSSSVQYGFMTLQHPKSRTMGIVADNRNNFNHQNKLPYNQQPSPFLPAPVLYPHSNASIIKRGYMTIPRKPRVPSYEPSHSHLRKLRISTSPSPSETETVTTLDLQLEPVYDNLGLRTTAGGNSTLNLPNAQSGNQTSIQYNMRDRPLPATPSVSSVTSSPGKQLQQKHFVSSPNLIHFSKIKYTDSKNDDVQEQSTRFNNLSNYNDHHAMLPTIDGEITVPIYSGTSHEPVAGSSKIPPRPPPKPKKKKPIKARMSQGSTSQLFDDEGEDGTEV